MTSRDRWGTNKRRCVQKYHNFRDLVKLYRVIFPEFGANITFCISMPKSWSKKKKESMDGMPHQQARYDIDNLIKALMDAALEEDGHVWSLGSVKKIWGYDGWIEIN